MDGLWGKVGNESMELKLDIDARVVVDGEVNSPRPIMSGRRLRSPGGAEDGSAAVLELGVSMSASEGLSSAEADAEGDGGDVGRLGVNAPRCSRRSRLSAGLHKADQASSLRRGPT